VVVTAAEGADAGGDPEEAEAQITGARVRTTEAGLLRGVGIEAAQGIAGGTSLHRDGIEAIV